MTSAKSELIRSGSHGGIPSELRTPDIATIEDIVASLKPPLVALKDKTGYIHDKSTLVLKCPRGHLHKYFLADIKASDGNVKCITCAAGNKFQRLVRETAEDLLGMPFILSMRKICPHSKAEFTNIPTKITIACVSRSDGSKWDGGLLEVAPMYAKYSVKKFIKKALRGYPLLSAEQKAKLEGRPYTKTPIPMSSELADISCSKTPNPLLSQMSYNIVSSKEKIIYLENC